MHESQQDLTNTSLYVLPNPWRRTHLSVNGLVTQATRMDLLRPPFNASPETASKFLRNLRTLKLHAFATSAMTQHGKSSHTAGGASASVDRVETLSQRGTVGDPGAGASQWQERKHTLNKVQYRWWGSCYG